MYSDIFCGYRIVFYCIFVLLCSNILLFNKRISVTPKLSMVNLPLKTNNKQM